MKRRTGWFVALAAGLWAFGFGGVRRAHAGCPPSCDIVTEPTTVQPELPGCARLDVHVSSDCGCELRVEVQNGCDTELFATDFTFDYCSDPRFADDGCMRLDPGAWGSTYEPLEEPGPREFRYSLETVEGDHTVTVRLDVRDIEDQGCSTSPRRVSRSGAGFVAAVLVGALWLRERRRRERQGEQSSTRRGPTRRSGKISWAAPRRAASRGMP